MNKSGLFAFLHYYRYIFLAVLIGIVSVVNMRLDIMEVDAAQYASISLEMLHTGSYLEVFHRHQDYLDKPPLLFWLSSLSISIFGNTSYAYKLPAVLLLWIGLWALYGFTKLWYDQKRAIMATFIFGSTQAFFLMTNDVRTDGLLTSMVLCSLYFVSLYLKSNRAIYLLMVGTCIGAAMLAKGPLGLIIPGVAITGHLMISGQWKKIWDPRWLLIMFPLVLVLSPMLYGLYIQFDLHPEKEVYGLKGPSGIWFYFWTQSFGRITGENYWQNNTSFFYFFGTLLWDFQPWVVLFIAAFIRKIKHAVKPKEIKLSDPEWISLCAFVIPFIALSFSRYKLPHYIFPLLPFAAIMTADWIVHLSKQIPRWLEIMHFAIIHLLIVLAALILIWIFPLQNYIVAGLGLLFYLLFWVWRKILVDEADRLVLPTVTIAIVFNLVFSLHFYPNLLKYQSSSQAGKLIATEGAEDVYWYKKYGHALDYYSGRFIPPVYPAELEDLPPGTLIYTNEDGLDEMPDHHIVKEFNDFPITMLNMQFLNPEKRSGKLSRTFLVEIKAQGK